ncbi:hypothetical protein L7F22_046089 [Adiantum nelumboides]|nr:hypothetical protein [Adiantum nelumboides]
MLIMETFWVGFTCGESVENWSSLGKGKHYTNLAFEDEEDDSDSETESEEDSEDELSKASRKKKKKGKQSTQDKKSSKAAKKFKKKKEEVGEFSSLVQQLKKYGVGTLENGLFVLDRYEKQIQACIAKIKTRAMQDAELWHARFGHVGYGSLMTLQCHNMVHDLSLLEMPPRHVCEGCVLGKMHRFAFSQDGFVRATQKLQLVHSVICGPMWTPSVGNSLYFVTFIDEFSRFCWVYPLKAKLDVFANFQHYVSMVENETGCKVQTLCTDRGGEYMSGAFKDFLGKKGIKHQCTMPYTPQQNGVVERKNRSLMEMARCMLKVKSFPHKLWMEAVACAAHVLNRCPTCALKTITPYESCYVGSLMIRQSNVYLWDTVVEVGYRLYNPATNKIFESRDVIFAETTAQPMVAFDVPHMQTQDVFEGFLPSFVENQESQQVDNFDQSFDQHVTPHDVEKILREEQEVLREERTLPKWVQKTLQDSKLDAPLPRKTRAGGLIIYNIEDVSVNFGLAKLLPVRSVGFKIHLWSVSSIASSSLRRKPYSRVDKLAIAAVNFFLASLFLG